jgi:dTDP-L-rhamnose 4-epimerase
MNVLVTGGSGFIGSHVVDLLVSEGHDVVVVDRVAPSHPNPAATFVQADLVEANDWAHVLNGIGAVSHQAAKVGLGLRFDDVTDYARDNDLATAVLLRELARARFAGRLVLASSMVVYGEGSYRCTACGPVRPGPRAPSRLEAGAFEPPCPSCGSDLVWAPVDEDAALDPRNIYAATKVHQEHLCSTFGRETGAPVIALRYHNVYGLRAPIDTPYAGVASLFLGSLHRGEAPRVFEDGGQTRDFVHVADVARANVASLCADVGVTGAFNVASGTPRSIADLARELWTVVGASGPPPVVTGEWRLGDVRHVVASPAKAAAHLDFHAAVPFRDGLRQLAQHLAPSPW